MHQQEEKNKRGLQFFMPPAATCLFWTLSKKPILLLFVFSPKRSRQISFGCELSQGQFFRTISLTLFAGRTETNSSLKMHAYLRFLLCARWGQKIGRKAERERGRPLFDHFHGPEWARAFLQRGALICKFAWTARCNRPGWTNANRDGYALACSEP